MVTNKKAWLFAGMLLMAFVGSVSAQTISDHKADNFVLVIHGGAGTLLKKNMTPKKENAYREKLAQALKAGQDVLRKKGSALDAVQTAVNIMENSQLFNAGKGSVFSHEGRNEMDASIMDGKNLQAGAVAGVMQTKNPINLARAVMEKSEHVMMTGEGAEQFGRQHGIEMKDPKYFYTQRRWEQLQKARKKDKKQLDHNGDKTSLYDPEDNDFKFGTVGAAALDMHGNLAAGTSTGGMTNKRWSRVGDSPVIGAGTYADNNSCALSATGHGEYFIRAVVAYSICAQVEFKGVSLQQAANDVINKKLVSMGGSGGIVAVDKKGNIAMTFNTKGMYRGFVKGNNEPVVKIYKTQ